MSNVIDIITHLEVLQVDGVIQKAVVNKAIAEIKNLKEAVARRDAICTELAERIRELSRPPKEREAVAWAFELEDGSRHLSFGDPRKRVGVKAETAAPLYASPPVALPEGCVDEVETKLARASEALKRLDDVIDFSQPWEPASDACKCVQHCNGGAEAWNAALRHAREVRAMLSSSPQAKEGK